jgi:5-methyltetrahydropteroyltriglutamate--homocysteine methyltransferase
VASDTIETPEDVAGAIEAVLKHVPRERIVAGTNCGMAPMRRDIAIAKLDALGRGVELARKRFG